MANPEIEMITQIIIRLHRLKRLFGVLLIYSIALTSVSAEEVPDASKVIIKVDSDGLRAEIIVTGRAALPEGLGVDSPQARLFTKKAAAACAYDNLVKIAEAIAPDYFPKERYFSEDGSLKGARLAEVRYLGDGSAEADLELDIALNGPLTNKFEKAMQLAGYRVCEYDRPNIEVTNNVDAATKNDKLQIQPLGGTFSAR